MCKSKLQVPFQEWWPLEILPFSLQVINPIPFSFSTEDQELWACGDNKEGQLGLGIPHYMGIVRVPVKTNLSKVVGCQTGGPSSSTFMLTQQ